MSTQPTPAATITAIVAAIVSQLEDRLAVQIQAAKDAHMAGTHSESVAESKYDTFGLESSYLAQGQQKRVEALTIALNHFKSVHIDDNFERQFIEPLTFITLADEQGLFQLFFLANQAGGSKIILGDKTISVITLESPIGKVLVDKMVGDPIDLLLKGKTSRFKVMSIN